MPTAVIVDIAEAVTVELNAAEVAGDFDPQAFTAARVYEVKVELPATETLQVLIAHRGYEGSVLNRKSGEEDYNIDIGILKKVALTDNTTLDAMMLFVEQIKDFFCLPARRLTEYTGALLTEWANAPVYDPEALNQRRLFFSLITLTYRVLR